MPNDETVRRITERIEQSMRDITGAAPMAEWMCEDGYHVHYTTGRVEGGPHHGKFLVQLFKPVGKGARTDPQEWAESYRREFATRKAAKKRALELYGKHSPKWLAKQDSDD